METQKQKDIETLANDKQKEINECFSYCESVMRLPEDQLKHWGHKTTEGAVFYRFKEASKTIDKLIQAHLKKYPD